VELGSLEGEEVSTQHIPQTQRRKGGFVTMPFIIGGCNKVYLISDLKYLDFVFLSLNGSLWLIWQQMRHLRGWQVWAFCPT